MQHIIGTLVPMHVPPRGWLNEGKQCNTLAGYCPSYARAARMGALEI
jgi:hypothetical protein